MAATNQISQAYIDEVLYFQEALGYDKNKAIMGVIRIEFRTDGIAQCFLGEFSRGYKQYYDCILANVPNKRVELFVKLSFKDKRFVDLTDELLKIFPKDKQREMEGEAWDYPFIDLS